jgi:hypothetical protein
LNCNFHYEYTTAKLCLQKSKLYYDRVSWPVCHGVRHPSGTHTQFFFLLEIFFRQLRVCYFVTPSLMRGWICNLLLLLVLASTVPFGSESRGTQDHILLSQFLRLPPTWRARSPHLYPRGTGSPRYTPGHWVPPPPPNTTRRATVEVLYPASTREDYILQKKSKSHYGRQSVGQSVLVSGTHLGLRLAEVEVNLRPTVSRPVCLGVGHPSGTRDQFFFLLEFSLNSCRFVLL